MTLIQIQNKVPPWHQSTELLTSCSVLYVESEIRGNPQPGGMDAARGTEVHHVGAIYFAHCAQQGVSTDLEAFDRFAAGAGPVAARILAGMRDSYEVDYEHLLATELTMSLDERFWPTHVASAIEGTCADSGAEPVVLGTLDGLYAFVEQGMMRVDDLKTHLRPFDPNETLQAKTYALLVFLHYPWVQKVVFRLIFVRYRKLVREAEFTRDMVPDLTAAIRAARARQIKIHEDYKAGKEMQALAGSHCWYCPLLSNAQCPIAKYNPAMQLTPQQRLNFYLWYSQFSRANNKAMKEYLDGTGKKQIVLKDYNGKAYTYGPVETETESYPVFKFIDGKIAVWPNRQPVFPIIDLMMSYAEDPDNQDDIEWMSKVVISSTPLKRYLKTKKRVMLDQAIEDTAPKVTKTPLRVSKPLDAVPEEDDSYDDYDEEEEFEM